MYKFNNVESILLIYKQIIEIIYNLFANPACKSVSNVAL